MRRRVSVSLGAACLAALGLASAAAGSTVDENKLAQRYAPVVKLVKQTEECGRGEPYEPIDVDALFHEPTVALRGPWGRDLVKIAPSARDLSPQRYEYHLDFPGDALDPGCGYERWGRRVTKGTSPTVYAHVATDPSFPGKLALQYWFYYVFNDWNNTHEGDWEMIQLDFDASNASDALAGRPISVGYSQHEGAERATWGDEKLELVDGTHPVVHPAAGSHANFYDEALFLGSQGSEGVGCDDTRGPTREIRPIVRTIPSDPAEARAAFPWIGFEGRWGELQKAFFNGPTGPNLKAQWTEPIRTSEDWRERSIGVPAGGAFGTGATDFFCGAVAAGSNALRRSLGHLPGAILTLLVLVVLIAVALSRATWRPATPFRLARRRAWGQVLAASARMYVKRLPLVLGIGLLALPISVIVTVADSLLLRTSSVFGVETEGGAGGVVVFVVVALGTALTLFGLGLVMAATARALAEIDRGRKIGPLQAYRMSLDGAGPLLVALTIASIVVSLLFTTVFLVPIAIWLAVRWALIAPVIELEGTGAIAGLRRSRRLVRQGWLKVASLGAAGAVLALALGPLLGAALILLTNVPLAWLNLVAGIVYTLTMPFVALATVYVYFDMRVRDELSTDVESVELPAEIQLA